MIPCPHCTAPNAAAARFCDACGQGLERVCPGCQAANRHGARFCSQCGSGLEGAAPAVAASRAEAARPGGLQIEADGERKHATVLFADVRGSTSLIADVDAETAIQLLDPALRIMQEAVERFGGVVNRRMGDGLMALFGAPIAAEDHALRACLAARAMVDGIAQMGDAAIAIRVGLCSGEVVIRPTGRDAADYDAMGVAAHIAARLEAMAEPGTILLPAATAQLVHGMTELQALGPQALRGIDTPMPLFLLVAAAERSSWEIRSSVQSLSRFVGRESELTQLGLALRRARLRRGQAVSIVADAGVGKSRLVHEFFRRLPEAGSEEAWQVMRIAATPQSTVVPYSLAGELLRALCGASYADPVASVAARLRAVLLERDRGADLVPLLSLLDATPPDAAWDVMDQPARRRRLVAALRSAVLAAAGVQPLILLVDDYHWADAPSLAVLSAVVESMGTARLLLLVTSRPERRPGFQDGHGLGADSFEIDLQPLARGSAEALLAELLGASDALAPLRARILAQADGTPLFLEEIASSLIESGVVRPGEDAAPEVAEVSIPVSVQAILAARIDRLPPARRRLLQLASVIGKDLALPLLAAISELGPAELAEELAALRVAGFLYETVQPGGIVHSFKHALTHAVAYDSLLRRHRRALHGRVLAAMEQIFATRLTEMTEQLASHAERGEVWSDAVRYCLAARERANARSAWQEAVAYLESAVRALSHLPQDPENVATAIAGAAAAARRAGAAGRRAPHDALPGRGAGAGRRRRAADAAGPGQHQPRRHAGPHGRRRRRHRRRPRGAGDDAPGWRRRRRGRCQLRPRPVAVVRRRLRGGGGAAGGQPAASGARGPAAGQRHHRHRLGDLPVLPVQHPRRHRPARRRPRRPDPGARRGGDHQPALRPAGHQPVRRPAAPGLRAAGPGRGRAGRRAGHRPRQRHPGPRALHRPQPGPRLRADRPAGEAARLLHDAMRYAAAHGLEGMRLLCGPALGLVQALSGHPDAVATCAAFAAAARQRQMRPAAVQALHVQGLAHARAGQPEPAEDCYRRAIAEAEALQMQPEATQARENLAALLDAAGRTQEAAAAAQAAASAWRQMGMADTWREPRRGGAVRITG